MRLRRTRAGTPATTAPGATSRVTTAPAPIRAPAPTVTPARMTAPLPIEAPRHTRVGTTCQSASVCGRPSAVARGSRSLMNITPWPTNTSSSIVTPSQTNVWLDTLQRAPITAFFCTSTKVPRRVSSPIRQPYRLTNAWMVTPGASVTSGAMREKLGGFGSGIADSVGEGGVGQDDAAALGADAAGGGLQVADDAQAQPAVADRRLALADALREVADDALQRLARFDVRAEHVAAAVTDQPPPPLLRVAGELDAAVV